MVGGVSWGALPPPPPRRRLYGLIDGGRAGEWPRDCDARSCRPEAARYNTTKNETGEVKARENTQTRTGGAPGQGGHGRQRPLMISLSGRGRGWGSQLGKLA